MSAIGAHINEWLNLVLGMIMFGLGLSLKKEDFKQLFDQPRSLAIGLVAQMGLLPLVAALIAYNINVSPELKVGILILSVCPGGITSNLISYFVRGNVALAVSLTVCNALLSLFSIPILVNLFLEHFLDQGQVIELPFWSTMLEIFLVTVFPAALGMVLRLQLGNRLGSLERVLNISLPLLLLGVFAFKFLAGPQSGGTNMMFSDVIMLTPAVIALNLGSMLLGFLVGLPFGLKFKTRITIAVEVGLHNTALALLIAGDKLGNPTMEKPALVYALFSFVLTYGIAWLLVKSQKWLPGTKPNAA
ncbi:MAG: bile acid:sodium symporter family protein [Bacteroidia bacterium]